MKKTFEKMMSACPLVAILRGITPEEVPAVCDALYESGIRILEIPLNSPDVFTSLPIAVKHCGDRMLVGAGTVITVDDVRRVADSGCSFVVSPNTDVEVIKETKRQRMISIPGFFTASEGFAAIKAGADYLKLFPAILGPGYVKDLKAVIKAEILAVGGVNSQNLASFLQVCCGAGIGSALYKSGKTLEDLKKDAAELVKVINA